MQLIPLPLESVVLSEILQTCDGFILPGGSDIGPRWGYAGHPTRLRNVDERLDLMDQLIIDFAYHNEIPLLGICRGMQSINVFRGGTLFEDLGQENITHEDRWHPINLLSSAPLVLSVYKDKAVFSSHHQGINTLAPGFHEVATWGGLTEAMTHSSLPIWGVQWHPEVSPLSESTQALFSHFVSLVEQKHHKKQ